MNLLVFLLGLVLLVVVSLDFLFTTVGAEERSILSLRMTRAVFRALRRTARGRDSGWRHRMSGPLVMVTLAALWVLGVALAWTLIFAAWPASVVAAPGQPAPGEWDVFAHVGHLLSTLGVGLTEPAGTVWYVVGSMVAVHGMLILTLSVSFTLSTTQTVSRGRAFVEFAEVVDPADPEAFDVLAPWLSEVCSALKSSPFALFYSSPNPRRRLSGALVRFAERTSRGERFGQYRHLLAMLPGLDASGDHTKEEFLAAMRSWSESYSLSR